MTTDYSERRRELGSGFRRLHTVAPQVMSGFATMHAATTADGALPAKTKELIALAIGIAGRCDGCIAFHTHDALKAGATRAEVEETIGVAIFMGGGPAAVYGSDALHALDQFAEKFSSAEA